MEAEADAELHLAKGVRKTEICRRIIRGIASDNDKHVHLARIHVPNQCVNGIKIVNPTIDDGLRVCYSGPVVAKEIIHRMNQRVHRRRLMFTRQTTFLIVDDDPAFTLLLKEAILAHFANADVITTDDGYEALLLIGERKPHIVMLDLKMPKLDGFEVLELLRHRKKDNLMKLVVLSAYLDAETREKLKKTIADSVWEKGKPVHEILRDLEDLVNPADQPKPRQLYAQAN